MLEEIRNSYTILANNLKDWKEINKNELIDGYIDNEDDPFWSEVYFAAVICRYWGNIGRYYNLSKKSVSIEECYDWLIDAVTYTLKKRQWRNPEHILYQDPNGPDKAMNQRIFSRRMEFYQYSNAAKRKDAYTMVKIEKLEEVYGDATEDLYEEAFVDNNNEIKKYQESKDFIDFIQHKIDLNNYVEAFIIDTICFQDSIGYTERENEIYKNFSSKKVVKRLSHLDNDDLHYFKKVYNVDDNKLNDTLNYFKGLTNVKIYSQINKTLDTLKKDERLKNLLCL